ncbi:hypothetical protein B0J14DRAFT_610217 [Halenospora varia]|nr:hypothetical protein B0J14DRAFT_610217 [Halenospora varia]
MQPTIFITGVTGYIGGHITHVLRNSHPEWNLVLLVRKQDDSGTISRIWPDVRIVIGSLDDHTLLVEEAGKADVVLQMASADHPASAKSLIQGLANHRPEKGTYIHTSGTGLLHSIPNGYGQLDTKVYSDLYSINEITSLPITASHRDADIAVLESGTKYGVKTAIIGPSTIYGVGEGPVKRDSIQIPWLVEGILKRGRGFTVGEGKNVWNDVHVDDLAAGYVLLAEQALLPGGGKADWGREGYYFPESGEHSWGDITVFVVKLLRLRGLLESEEVDELTVEQAREVHPWAESLWGGNSRSKGDRMRALGWEGRGKSVWECLEETVAVAVGKFERENAVVKVIS